VEQTGRVRLLDCPVDVAAVHPRRRHGEHADADTELAAGQHHVAEAPALVAARRPDAEPVGGEVEGGRDAQRQPRPPSRPGGARQGRRSKRTSWKSKLKSVSPDTARILAWSTVPSGVSAKVRNA